MSSVTETLVGAPVGTSVNRSIDHFSRFLGLSVGNLYLLAALCTLWEVTARYVFHAPTQWAFEVVMVLCATAWMLSAGFVTLHKRHIGITVLYLMASKNKLMLSRKALKLEMQTNQNFYKRFTKLQNL